MAGNLALIGPYTWDLLLPQLSSALAAYGLSDRPVGYGFGKDVEFWSGHDAALGGVAPRGAIVLHDARLLFQEFLANPRSARDPRELADEAGRFLFASIERVSRAHEGTSWVVGTADSPHPSSLDGVGDPAMDKFSQAIDAFNHEVITACRTRPEWSVFDIRRLASAHGSARLTDVRLDLLGRFPTSREGARWLAERLAAHWAALQGRMKKVLGLDCDNTLWGGVVGEDGVNGIQVGNDGIGRAYAMFQQALLALESRGTLLALCSRNNPPDIEEVFARRVEMPLSRDRIVAAHIGWDPKPQGLRSLAETLSLGLDSFVFVDDSPTEREEVRHVLPDVTVPEFPGIPADLAGFGYELGWRYFYSLSLTAEDARRTERYGVRRMIHAESLASEDAGAFHRSLNMTARLARNSPRLVSRNAQLSQKTNQFNLTLRRYTEADVERMSADPGCLVISGELADRFTDHGWVALAILKWQSEPASWLMDTLLFSCRGRGWGFEQVFTAGCIDRVRSIEAVRVRAEDVPGPKNIQTREFYDRLGFVLLSTDESGAWRDELPADRSVAREVDCIALNWAED